MATFTDGQTVIVIVDKRGGWLGAVGDIHSGNDADGYRVCFTDILAGDDPCAHLLGYQVGELAPYNPALCDAINELAALRAQVEALNVQIAMAMGFTRGVASYVETNHVPIPAGVILSFKDFNHLRDMLKEISAALEAKA